MRPGPGFFTSAGSEKGPAAINRAVIPLSEALKKMLL